MSLREEMEKGYEGRISFRDIVESDLKPEERADAKRVRLEGIRRRWLVHEGNVPRLVLRERVEEDIDFQRCIIEGLQGIVRGVIDQRNQAAFAAQRLQERVHRLEAEKAEKKILAPNGREMRAVLASKAG